MNITIGMFAHVDAGKTTLAEQLLYRTGSIRQRGRVDHKDTFLDSHTIEKERGITVFADQAMMEYKGNQYYLVDTPGHVDFSPEMERMIRVMDAAVIVVSAVEGVQGHTETVWQLLRKHRVPTFFFINKIDRTGADAARVLEELRQQLTPDVCDLSEAEEGAEAAWIEFVAERDEGLLELYMEDAYDSALWQETMKRLVRCGRIFPCMKGSALQDVGVEEFLDKLALLTGTDYNAEGPLAARAYKIRYDENGTRTTYIKVLKGTLRVREEVEYGSGDGRRVEKVTQIRVISGNKSRNVDQASAGQLVAVTGLSAAAAGEGIGALEEQAVYDIVPTLKSKVVFQPPLHVKDVLRCFQMLNAEDPSLNVLWEEQLQEIHIHVMGIIQLEVLEQLVRERFGFQVTFGPPEILYKETLDTVVIGCGHFEPLGHYAEVHLRLEPAERDSGIQFENECHPDVLPAHYQHLVCQHLFERDHHGLLTGSPLTDVRITLLKGRAHNKHTSGGDFREAAFRALRQGLEQAENVLLEPYYDFKIKVELDQMGRVLTDIQQARGRFDPPETLGSTAVLTGRVPVATFMGYSMELAALTHGKGSIRLTFGGYEPCHNAAEVIERRGYAKHADPAYSSSSIFCSKGQGYTVPWDEAAAHMHV